MMTSTEKLNTPSKLPKKGKSLLPQWGLIFVEGPDAATLLQSQLSNSVLGLQRIQSGQIAQSQSELRLAGYCNPKGRLLASAWLGLFSRDEAADGRFVLFISQDIAAVIAKRLSMYVLRSQVKVTDVSSEWQVLGCYESDVEMNTLSIESGALALRLPDVLVGNQSYGRVLVAQEKKRSEESVVETDLEEWNSLEVLSAIPRVVLSTQEQFVPQMINFESVLGVDFKKGCYPGQEIVARSQYRGAVKRRLQLAHIYLDPIDGNTYGPATELFHSEDPNQPAGMVVLAAPNPQEPHRIDLQIECKLEALETGELHLANITGPVLKIDSLPYPLLEI